MLDPQLLIRCLTLQMPFGKYQGRLIADLPEDYLLWFAKKEFPGGELGTCMVLMLEIRINGLEDLLNPLRKSR